MNNNENKETVLQLLPTDDAILQLAEECVELCKEFFVFDKKVDRTQLAKDTAFKMLSGVREEAADVELAAEVLLCNIYTAYDRRILHSMVGSIMIVVKDLGLIRIQRSLHEVCHDLAKAALKLRRTRYGDNPTPIIEEEAMETLLCHISMILALDAILFNDAERKQIEEIKEQKLERWAMRLKGETADGEREGVLLDKSAN